MENPRSEVYLEKNTIDDCTRVDIFSHVKKEWVFNKPVHIKDVLPLLRDLMIKPDSTIIHISENHILFNQIKAGKFFTKHFNGLSGQYRVRSDGSIYELEYEIPHRPPKKNRMLMARCIQSREKTKTKFEVVVDHILQYIRLGAWVKIEQ